MSPTCPDLTDSKSLWSFCPSLAASITFTILFGLTACLHITQAALHRNKYCWVIIMSCLWQTLCYIFRCLSIMNPASFGDYAAWFVLILVAPLLTNAFVYMVVARAVWQFTPSHSVWHIKAWNLSAIFVTLDIVAFVVQVYGAASATGQTASYQQTLHGLHIYMGGVGLQQLFIIIFSILVVQVLWGVRRVEKDVDRARRATLILGAVLVVLLLITVRIVFRICEYAQGLNSTIPNHEAFQYSLDSLPMLLALWVFNLAHPGRLMSAIASEMPSFRQRRRLRKEQNMAREQTLSEAAMESDGVCELAGGLQTKSAGSIA